MSTWNPTSGGLESSRRRSQRVILSVPVTIKTEGGSPEASFEEETQTLVVNAHGSLVALAGKVEKGQTLQLINRVTREEQLCHVMYLGPSSGGKVQVGIEFKKPSPGFWRIAFPPEDWSVPESEHVTRPEKQS